jgi:hypothetical protein
MRWPAAWIGTAPVSMFDARGRIPASGEGKRACYDDRTVSDEGRVRMAKCWEERGCDKAMQDGCVHAEKATEKCPSRCSFAQCYRATRP